jgi:hypothetical protein
MFEAAMSDMNVVHETLPHQGVLQKYFLDLAASVKTFISNCETIRDVNRAILNSIPEQFKEIYTACGTYQLNSIKNSERKYRGQVERYVLKSPDMKIPHDLIKFLSVGENKERLFNLILEGLTDEKDKLGSRVVYFSKITSTNVNIGESLRCTHEEADRKLVALVRSPSGDIDILCLFLSQKFNFNIYIDNETGANRKISDLYSTSLSAVQRKAVLGVHALTENDYVSSFFRKGKKACWKMVLKYDDFIDLFAGLGNNRALSALELKRLLSIWIPQTGLCE